MVVNSLNSSSVKVWVWRTPSGHSASPTCTHSALETSHHGIQKYMSFRVNCPLPACNKKPHFHDSKDKDDRVENGKTAISYDLQTLDVLKINKAFQEFRKNPVAFGSLGWGILQKPYAFNGAGLTTYLLEKGGIFSLTSYKRNDVISRILQTVVGTGIFATGFSWFTSNRFQSLAESTSQFGRYNRSFSLALGEGILASNDANVIEDQSKKMVELYRQTGQEAFIGEMEQITNTATKINELLGEVSPLKFQENIYVIPSIRGSASDASKQLFAISKTAAISVIFAGVFFILERRFLQCDFSSSNDVERLVISAHAEEERGRVQLWDRTCQVASQMGASSDVY